MAKDDKVEHVEKKTEMQWALDEARITKEEYERRKEERKTFRAELNEKGWPSYYASGKIELLGNGLEGHETIGFSDGTNTHQIAIDAPVDLWIDLLTKLSKKVAKA